MKKLRRFATGFLCASITACVSPVAFAVPATQSVVLAEDDGITVEAGDAFEITAELPTDGYGVRIADSAKEFDTLSATVFPRDGEDFYDLYYLMVINAPGQYEVVVDDADGNIVKEVLVNVTEPENSDDESGDNDSDESGESTDSDNSEEGQGAQDESGDEEYMPDFSDGIGAEDSDQGTDSDAPQNEPELVVFLPITQGEISGTTGSGEFRPGEKMTLSVKADKGYVFRRWVVRTLEGVDISNDLNIGEDNTFTLPDFPIRISAELEYNLIHEVELLDVTDKLEVGKPIEFSGHVKDNTDGRFFLLAEIWINEFDTKGITNSEDINKTISDQGVALLDKVEAGDKYNYSVIFMTTEGYEFAEDVKLIYNGKEYSPTGEDGVTDGKETVTFSGFLSFGEQTNKPETKTTTRTVTRQENKTETVTQYVYNTYTYTTYKYVTRYVTNPTGTTGSKIVKTVSAPLTGDKNTVGVWIALAIAAGGGVVSGILVGRKRKRNK